MKTLAIGNDTKIINFAIFYGNKLSSYGKIENEANVTLYDSLSTILKENEIAFVVLQAIDFDKTTRRYALEAVKVRTVIKLVCEKLGVIYTTPSTYGFDRFFFGDRIQGKKLKDEKLKIANDMYDLNIDNEDLAEAIILGWAFQKNQLKTLKEGVYMV